MPQAIVIARPDGTGKTSAAPALIEDAVGPDACVNADVIAKGQAPGGNVRSLCTDWGELAGSAESGDVNGDPRADPGGCMSRRSSDEIVSSVPGGTAIDRAIVASRRRVIQRHRLLAVPFAIWRGGHVVELSPESADLPGDPSDPKADEH
jgi:hypothetical protein